MAAFRRLLEVLHAEHAPLPAAPRPLSALCRPQSALRLESLDLWCACDGRGAEPGLGEDRLAGDAGSGGLCPLWGLYMACRHAAWLPPGSCSPSSSSAAAAHWHCLLMRVTPCALGLMGCWAVPSPAAWPMRACRCGCGVHVTGTPASWNAGPDTGAASNARASRRAVPVPTSTSGSLEASEEPLLAAWGCGPGGRPELWDLDSRSCCQDRAVTGSPSSEQVRLPRLWSSLRGSYSSTSPSAAA